MTPFGEAAAGERHMRVLRHGEVKARAVDRDRQAEIAKAAGDLLAGGGGLVRILPAHRAEALDQQPGMVDAGGGHHGRFVLRRHAQSIVTPVARTTADQRSISART